MLAYRHIFRLTLLLAIIGDVALASRSGGRRKPQSVTTMKRLTWAPMDHFRKGFQNAPWVKDPFFPENNELRLSGVISKQYAFINGKWYRAGDRVEGFTVRQIEPKSVVLSKGTDLRTLTLGD